MFISFYRETSNILINGPYIDSFRSNDMNTVMDKLEKNKIQIKSTKTHLKEIISNAVTNNSTTANKYINNAVSISWKHLTPKVKETYNPTKEKEGNSNLLYPEEKEMQANKNQSQNKEKRLYTNRLNLNENTTSNSSWSYSQCQKEDHRFMMECSEF